MKKTETLLARSELGETQPITVEKTECLRGKLHPLSKFINPV